MKINIGFRFSKQTLCGVFNTMVWNTYEVVGITIGKPILGSYPEWKKREDITDLPKYLQIMTLPYPNHNGLYHFETDMKNSQLNIFTMKLDELIKQIEEDMKLLPEHRRFQIDEPFKEVSDE